MEPVTNQDLYERLEILEVRVDMLIHKMDQAMGAWTFIKIICSFAVGLAVVWSTVSNFFKP